MDPRFAPAWQAVLDYGDIAAAREGIDFEAIDLIVLTDQMVASAHREASEDRDRYPNGFGGICCLCGTTMDALNEKVVPVTPDRAHLQPVTAWGADGTTRALASACPTCRAALPTEFVLYA